MSAKTFEPTRGNLESKRIEPVSKGTHIAVVGAGAFGGWTALHLLRKGYQVTLIDAWGPGNSRSSSGDETRVIRSTYGNNEFYFNLNVRALQLWKEHEQRWQKKIFQNKGVLWMCYRENTPIVDDSILFAEKNKTPYERLSNDELNKRFPLVNTSDLHHAYLDPFGGCLRARESCQLVQKTFIDEGGKYVQSFVQPGNTEKSRLVNIKLSNGNTLQADVYVFACGSWLGKLFPAQLGSTITCTKQEVYYFGVPSHHAAALDSMPVWVDVDGNDFYYGIPGNQYRGFKIGVDKRGETFDPTTGDRIMNQEVFQKARNFIAHRFPVLKDAPLIESRVCPYENSPDGNFIFDHHPEINNLFFMGGGSGHGFKHGPAFGEMASNILAGESQIPSMLRLR